MHINYLKQFQQIQPLTSLTIPPNKNTLSDQNSFWFLLLQHQVFVQLDLLLSHRRGKKNFKKRSLGKTLKFFLSSINRMSFVLKHCRNHSKSYKSCPVTGTLNTSESVSLANPYFFLAAFLDRRVMEESSPWAGPHLCSHTKRMNWKHKKRNKDSVSNVVWQGKFCPMKAELCKRNPRLSLI